jgi:serine/threonine protein phosphatase PrpC
MMEGAMHKGKPHINLDVKRFLSKPVIHYGCYAMAGGRDYQEDRITAVPDVNYSGIMYFAVFDGHGGSYVSDYLCRNFHLHLSNHSLFKYQTSTAFDEIWQSYDDKLFDACRRLEADNNMEYFPVDGSTATVALIKQDELFITNCGDSAAFVVFNDGESRMVTEDHGILNEEERARCTGNGAEFLSPKEYERRLKEQQKESVISRHDEADNALMKKVNDASYRQSARQYAPNTDMISLLSRCWQCCLKTKQKQPTSSQGLVTGSGSASAQSTSLKKRREIQSKGKQRIYPGGLLVTRSFGDFYGKQDSLGGIRGGIIADHGQLIQIDMRRDKVQFERSC